MPFIELLTKVALEGVKRGAVTLLSQPVLYTAISNAIETTDNEFGDIEGVSANLRRWCFTAEFAQFLYRLTEGNPTEITEESCVASFVNLTGFYNGEETYPTAIKLLNAFSKNLLRERLKTLDFGFAHIHTRMEVLVADNQNQFARMEELLLDLSKAVLERKEDRDVLRAEFFHTGSHTDSAGKHWRPLEISPLVNLGDSDKALSAFAEAMMLGIRRTFNKLEYVKFTAVIDSVIDTENGSGVLAYRIISHYPELCTNIADELDSLVETFARLRSTNASREEIEAFKSRKIAERNTLTQGWHGPVDLNLQSGRTVAEIEYDALVRRLSLKSIDDFSINPQNFPNRVRTTSECLRFLVSIKAQRSLSVHLNPLTWYLSENSPLQKLLTYMKDHREFVWNRILFNVDDREKWDYINTDLDVETHA